MGEVAGEGRTVLFVSHNMGAVNSLCTRAVMFRGGVLVIDDRPDVTIQSYLADFEAKGANEGERFFPLADDSASPFMFRVVRTLDQSGRIRSEFNNLEPITVEFEFLLRERIPRLMIGFELKTTSEITVFRSFHNDITDVLHYRPDCSFRYRLRSLLPAKLLNGGTYYIDACVGIHKEKWLIKDLRLLSIHLGFDVPNHNYVYDTARPGCVGPILDWFEVADND